MSKPKFSINDLIQELDHLIEQRENTVSRVKSREISSDIRSLKIDVSNARRQQAVHDRLAHAGICR